MADSWPVRVTQSLIIFGSGIGLCVCAYSAYQYWKKRELKSIDEGFEDVSRLEESPDRRILVLGLERAGKSSILARVTSDASKEIRPTEGFNVTCLHNELLSLHIWEIGGRESVRRYWGNFIQDTDLLVFVVDAADPHNLALAVKEVKTLLGDERLAKVPVLVLANKQDLHGAMKPEEVAAALDLGSISPLKHKVRVLGTQAPPGVDSHPSIDQVKSMLLTMSSA